MNFKEYQSITINGRYLTGQEMVDFCRQAPGRNMHLLAEFLRYWLDNDPSISVQTSGSTGTPKMLLVEKNQMLQSAEMTAQYFGFKSGQTALLCLPLNYIAGKMMVVRALFSGLNLICIEPGSSPLEAIPEGIEIGFAPLVPMQLNGVMHTGFIRKILLGGAPLSPKQEERYQLMDSEIYQSYGMTETLSHVAIRRVNGRDRSDVYYGLPGVIFGVDEDDCLQIDVPFLSDRVYTNDIVELLGDRKFIWRGRKDNVINSGGIKFFPEEIEKKLHSFVSQKFFVAGMPDERFGEKLCLFIEAKPFDDKEMQTLMSNFVEKLDAYEKPREIFFVDEFQMTTSGKIMRKESIRSVLGNYF